MSEAAISTGGGATPQPISPVAGARGQHRMNADSFLDGFEGLAQESEAQSEPEAPRPKPRVERPAKAKAERQAAEREPPEEALDGDELPEAVDPALEDAPLEAVAPDPEEDDGLLPQGKGTRENPLTIKDLPKDKFLEVKIDGQKVVVDLAEAVEGAYMRPEYFHRYVNGVKTELGKARQVAERAVRGQEAASQHWASILGSPEGLLGYLFDNPQGEDVLEQVAIGFAKIRRAEQDNPELRLRRIRARDERELARRRQELDSREHAERTTRENQTRIAQLQESWRPGIEAGLRAAGFPAGLREWPPELREEVDLQLSRLRRRKGTIAADDWATVIPAAAKAVGAKPVSAPERRPVPAPRPAARSEAPQRRPANGNVDWDSIPHNQKMRDPKFFWR